MQRQSEHTYSLPSRDNLSNPRPIGQHSAPPSPKVGILQTSKGIYGHTSSSSPSTLAQKHRTESSSSLTNLSRATQQGLDITHFLSAEKLGYQPQDWTLLAIQRAQGGTKYVVTLMYLHTMTLYTWPFDPRKPPAQGTCFITPIASDNTEASSPAVLRKSLRVLEDCLRTWIRHSRAKSPMRGSSRLIVSSAEIDLVNHLLHLYTTTEDQREDWLQRQKLPAELPGSVTTSPSITPPISDDGSILSLPDMRRHSRQGSLSPRGPISPRMSPLLGRGTALQLQCPSAHEDDAQENAKAPAISITEPSPVSLHPALPPPPSAAQKEFDKKLHDAIDALSLATSSNRGASSAPALPSCVPFTDTQAEQTIPQRMLRAKREPAPSKTAPRAFAKLLRGKRELS